MPSKLQAGQSLPDYTVRAHNSAEQSDNKIHDNAVARLYGFEGGLVPGVTIHGYMTRPALDALGREWLEHGAIATRFIKPFYQDELVTVHSTVVIADETETQIELRAVNPKGETCAIGTASLSAIAPQPPSLRDVPAAPLATIRPLVSHDVLASMDILGTIDMPWQKVAEDVGFLEIQDDHAAYRGADAVLHPGYLLRFANFVLAQAVTLGPWIHVSSDVQHFSTLKVGEGFATRARITELFEKKGHKFITMDVLQVCGDRPVTRVTHTAIFDIRRVDA